GCLRSPHAPVQAATRACSTGGAPMSSSLLSSSAHEYGSTGQPVLAVHDLSVQVASDAGIVQAVKSLALAIAQGQTFALVGESGCGKSMTALALLRLLPEAGQITAGRVQL